MPTFPWKSCPPSRGIRAHDGLEYAGYHVEYVFKGGSDAAYPQATLLSFDGKLFGTSPLNGANGLGAVYSLDPTSGAETVVYSFKGGSDGSYVYSNLIDVANYLYGTTSAGGVNNFGTVFSLDPSTGAETVLYTFKGGRDGSRSVAGLRLRGDKLYGTTVNGGDIRCIDSSGGCGTVFSIDLITGAERLVYAFKGGSDGAGPESSLIDVNGTLYGTTAIVGFNSGSCAVVGCGTVFSFDPNTGVETVVYAFKGNSDGAYPVMNLTNVGNALYGTTEGGGIGGFGTVFSLNLKTGAEKVVYSFKGGTDGERPMTSLVDVGGTLYGTTESGGGYKRGTVFSLNVRTGAETVLHVFKGRDQGKTPVNGLTYIDHRLYGTTDEGGGYPNCGKIGCGTVFVIRP